MTSSYIPPLGFRFLLTVLLQRMNYSEEIYRTLRKTT